MDRTVTAMLIVCLMGLCTIADAADFTDCGSAIGKFTSVTVSGCDKSKQTCDLVRGTNATINIQFTVDKDVQKVTTVVHAVLMDVSIFFPIPKPDACANPDSMIQCPLKKGTEYSYHATLPVERSYPQIRHVTVKWELQNEKKEDIVCIHIPTRIK